MCIRDRCNKEYPIGILCRLVSLNRVNHCKNILTRIACLYRHHLYMDQVIDLFRLVLHFLGEINIISFNARFGTHTLTICTLKKYLECQGAGLLGDEEKNNAMSKVVFFLSCNVLIS